MSDLSTPSSARTESAISTLRAPLSLPCGAILPGRLVKCPMQETLASPPLCEPPIEAFRNLYSRWAKAGFGCIVTGQVQIDLNQLSTSTDVAVAPGTLEDGRLMGVWKEWASIAQEYGTPGIVQLGHPGKKSQRSTRPSGMPSLAPSAIPVQVAPGLWNERGRDWALGRPKEMSLEEIDDVVDKFVYAAQVVKEAGWSGVGIHAAHGFLLSEFCSSHSNRRTDSYGGSPSGRLRLLQRIVSAVRDVCPAPLIVQVKLNSQDFVQGGLDEDEALGQVRWLVTCGMVDIVEISGGNGEGKESPLHTSMAITNTRGAYKMDPAKAESTLAREAYFARFGQRIRDELPHTGVAIQLSGGFRTRLGMASCVHSGTCDLVGLGRTTVLEPEFPARKILNESVPDEMAVADGWTLKGTWILRWAPIPRSIKGSWLLGWFYMQQRRMGRGLTPDPSLSMARELLSDFSLYLLQTFCAPFVRIVDFVRGAISVGIGVGRGWASAVGRKGVGVGAGMGKSEKVKVQ